MERPLEEDREVALGFLDPGFKVPYESWIWSDNKTRVGSVLQGHICRIPAARKKHLYDKVHSSPVLQTLQVPRFQQFCFSGCACIKTDAVQGRKGSGDLQVISPQEHCGWTPGKYLQTAWDGSNSADKWSQKIKGWFFITTEAVLQRKRSFEIHCRTSQSNLFVLTGVIQFVVVPCWFKARALLTLSVVWLITSYSNKLLVFTLQQTPPFANLGVMFAAELRILDRILLQGNWVSGFYIISTQPNEKIWFFFNST